MSWLANVAYALAAVVYLPVLVYQQVFQRKNRSGWGEKLAGPSASRFGPKAWRRRVWVHGVSLGEINAARGIIEGLKRGDAESGADGVEVVVSTTTDTGYARARQLFGEDAVFRYPLDFSWTVKRALDRVQPDQIVLMELEVWHNLVTLAARRGIPVAVVNGRLTERSCSRLQMLGPLARRMFRSLAWVGAQEKVIADRFVLLGLASERLAVTGSVKWDTASVAERVDGQEALASAVGIDAARPLLVCGSTGPGEEEQILEQYGRLLDDGQHVQLAIVPRKPERFDEVARLIGSRGFACVRRSACGDGEGILASSDNGGGRVVVLGDTMGELRKFYALASVVFVGRSLVAMGGSDPMEVAALGKPIVVGPHMENFAEPVRKLSEGGGLQQEASAADVFGVVKRWLADREAASAAGRAAREVVIENQGATQATLRQLRKMMG